MLELEEESMSIFVPLKKTKHFRNCSHFIALILRRKDKTPPIDLF